jgi:4-amino-4-deoxy-L-arabinose transferase-like glycosyltransferase
MKISKGFFGGFLKSDVTLFVLVFVVLAMVYGYQKTSFIPPQGLHQWRQCVGASYAMNYYNYDLDITQPRIYNHIAQGGTTDKTIAECPIIYYFIGVLYKILGPDDAIFRIVNALILFLGLFFLFKAARLLIKDRFWSLLLPVLLFTSPTLIFYGNGFLPDTSAFGLVLVALFFIVKYSQSPKIKYLYFAAIIYTIAGLFKITALLSFISLSATFVLMQIFSKDFRKKFKFMAFIVPMLIPVVLVLIWYYFVHFYNTHFGGSISPVAIRPIWILDEVTITKTWARIQNEWLNSYFQLVLLYIILGVFILSLILFRKLSRFMFTLSLLTVIGATGFFFLFFRSFHAHDYYVINLYVVVVFVLINGLLILKKHYPNIFHSYIARIIVLGLVVFFISKAPRGVESKHFSYYNFMHRNFYSGLIGLEEKKQGGRN